MKNEKMNMPTRIPRPVPATGKEKTDTGGVNEHEQQGCPEARRLKDQPTLFDREILHDR
ncbi:MAG: hypothetical protein RBT11_19780 [Desulfobacterales bacterium]|nr:hypothetical protein [Desulfobacterales bacterium]